MSILPASVADADRIGAFQTRCWDQSYRGVVSDGYLDGTTWQLRAARWADRIESGARRVWLARIGPDLVGVASTSVTPPDRADLPALELSSIYVDERAHGSGVAPTLLSAAIGDEAAHLLVFTVNLRAQRFYAKHGFEASDEMQVDPDTGLEEQRWVRHGDHRSGSDRDSGRFRRMEPER